MNSMTTDLSHSTKKLLYKANTRNRRTCSTKEGSWRKKTLSIQIDEFNPQEYQNTHTDSNIFMQDLLST